MEWIILAVLGWLVIGVLHAAVQRAGFISEFQLRYAFLEPSIDRAGRPVLLSRFNHIPHSYRDIHLLMWHDFILTTILGLGGVILVGADWLVRNWPECLVVGGNPKEGERFSNLCENGWVIIAVTMVAAIAGCGPGISLPIGLGWAMFWVFYNLHHSQPAPAAPVAIDDGNVSDASIDYYSQRYKDR